MVEAFLEGVKRGEHDCDRAEYIRITGAGRVWRRGQDSQFQSWRRSGEPDGHLGVRTSRRQLRPDNCIPDGSWWPFPFPRPSWCFIATAAYGTDTAEEINILREFRDVVLLASHLGAEFVSLYYEVSPPIAGVISQYDFLRTAVRAGFIEPVVAILNWSHTLWSERD